MTAPTILIVEDNPVSLQLMGMALSSERFTVVEAQDGKSALARMSEVLPDLVLQDLGLPDMDGLVLVRRLRELPGAADVPILAISGFTSKLEEARATCAGFTDFIVKPVGANELIETVRAHLHSAPLPSPNVGRGHRIVVADDNPVALRLAAMRLDRLGFRVTTASNGAEALDAVREGAPDALVTDVLMPKLDGFKLCHAIRSDSKLARLPVILVTSAFVESGDRHLAESVGADALVVRTPGLETVVERLVAALGKTPPQRAATPPATTPLGDEYLHRVVRQLERQVTTNATLSERCTLQAAELAALTAISESLARHREIELSPAQVLAQSLNAGGISTGAIFRFEPGGQLVCRAAVGCEGLTGTSLDALVGSESAARIVGSDSATVVPSPSVTESWALGVLSRLDVASLVMVPLIAQGERLGVLLLASQTLSLDSSEWLPFARNVAVQISQTLAIARSFTQIVASKRREAALNAAVEMRDHLLGVASHDLKAPLSAILFGASLIAHAPQDAERVRRSAENVRRAADRMKTLIEDLLDVARLEAGAFTVTKRSCDLGPIVSEVVSMLEPSAAERGVRLTVGVPSELRVACDCQRIFQVLSNLVSNAIKFTNDGGAIAIEAASDDGMLRFAVRDDGAGIPPEKISRVFERYWTGDEHGRSGTGLGLFISKGIVEAHGGRIWIESEVGRGTTVRFTLPVG